MTTIQSLQAEVPQDVVDLEAYAKDDRPVPKGARYRFRVDKSHFEVDVSSLTGRQILALASKTPEGHHLYQKRKGQKPVGVQPNDAVDLTQPGVERFETLPKDSTEG